jgi:integration host factor subunit alpha
MALTKDKIINEVYTKLGFRKNDARHVVEQLLEIMKRTLQNGEDLLISGFGKFVVKEKKARRGRNPQTRRDLQLRARRVVVFKTSGILRKKINSRVSSSLQLLFILSGLIEPLTISYSDTIEGAVFGTFVYHDVGIFVRKCQFVPKPLGVFSVLESPYLDGEVPHRIVPGHKGQLHPSVNLTFLY